MLELPLSQRPACVFHISFLLRGSESSHRSLFEDPCYKDVIILTKCRTGELMAVLSHFTCLLSVHY